VTNGKNAQDVMKTVKMIGGFLMLNGKDMFLKNGGAKTYVFHVIYSWFVSGFRKTVRVLN